MVSVRWSVLVRSTRRTTLGKRIWLWLCVWQYRRLFSESTAHKLKTWKSFDSLESIKMTHFSLILMHGRAHFPWIPCNLCNTNTKSLNNQYTVWISVVKINQTKNFVTKKGWYQHRSFIIVMKKFPITVMSMSSSCISNALSRIQHKIIKEKGSSLSGFGLSPSKNSGYF